MNRMSASALAPEAREVFNTTYLKAYAEHGPLSWEDEGQAHDEATQEAVEAVVVFVTDRLKGGLSVDEDGDPREDLGEPSDDDRRLGFVIADAILDQAGGTR